MSARPRILLVEDDREILRALGIRFPAAGYEIIVAHDGEAGIAAATADQPDAIVLDIRMPGMDGLTALAKLREQETTRQIPALILSAGVTEKTRNRAFEPGARYFLLKPCDTKTPIKAIRSAIGGIPCLTETTANAEV